MIQDLISDQKLSSMDINKLWYQFYLNSKTYSFPKNVCYCGILWLIIEINRDQNSSFLNYYRWLFFQLRCSKNKTNIGKSRYLYSTRLFILTIVNLSLIFAVIQLWVYITRIWTISGW